jgi:hypothetical protein
MLIEKLAQQLLLFAAGGKNLYERQSKKLPVSAAQHFRVERVLLAAVCEPDISSEP